MTNRSRIFRGFDIAELSMWMVFAMILLLSIVLGFLIGSQKWLLLAVVLFAIPGIWLMLNPTRIVWLSLAIGLVVAGLARLYAPGLETIRWAVLPLGVALIVHCALQTRSRPEHLPGFVWLMIVFFGYAIAASFISNSSTSTSLLGLKGYFQTWGLVCAGLMLHFAPNTRKSLAYGLVGIAFLQLPFVIHQFLFIVPTRVDLGGGIVPVDIVAGTFGAQRLGGGENSVLTAYLTIISAAFVALWKSGRISGLACLAACAALVMPIAVTESKISIVYLIAALFIVVFDGRTISAAKRLLTIGIGFVLIAGVAVVFVLGAPAADKVRSLAGLLDYTWQYNVKRDRNFEDALSRVGAYKYWAQAHRHTPYTAIVGHGPGVSRYPDSQIQQSEKRYGIDPALGIGRSGATAVLWDLGVIGFLMIIGIFILAYRHTAKLRRYAADGTVQSAVLTTVKVSLAVLFISFFDKGYFSFQIGYQSIFIATLACLCWMSVNSSRSTETTTA